MELLLLITIMISFLISLFILPSWIKRAKHAGLIGRDMNKYKKREVIEAGGISVIVGFVLALFYYIALKTFYFESAENVVEILALISVILIISFIGMIDDILGWKIGLGKRFRIFLILFAAIPLMVINAGETGVGIPLIDGVDLGILYPLFIIPIGILGASVSFNFIAGYNGLEAGQGIILLSGIGFVAFFTGSSWLSLIALCMIASLSAFWLFNRYPAKMFPGNVLTYSVGALIASLAILGNFERIAVFFYIPYIIETFLKSRGKLRKESFAKPNKDDSLEMPYKRIYGLEHFAILFLKKIKLRRSGKVYENDVVYFIHSIQILVIILGFIIFRNYLF